MAAPIGGLYVDLRANNARFEEDLHAAQTTARQAAGRMGGHFGRFRRQAEASAQSILNLRNAMRLLTVIGVGGLGYQLTRTIKTAMDFESAVADLSAITGATGDDLKFLSDRAREFGATTTLSAVEAAEAFKLIASAKPDLLENLDALAEVTKQTITLAEASGTALPDAARTLGIALNQAGAGAKEAARFVNVLAAGAKFGASEVVDTAAALQKAGVSATGAGASFEELNAAIQILAANGIKMEEAGTALRNIFLNLQTQSDDKFNPALVGLAEAFQNLREESLTAGEAELLFGKRAFDAGNILIQNVGQLESMTAKLTGTNVAAEQAAVRFDTLTGDLKQLVSAFAEVQIQVGEKTTPSLRALVQETTAFLRDSERVEQVGRNLAVALGAIALQSVAAQAGLLSVGTAATTANTALVRLAATMAVIARRFAVIAAILLAFEGVQFAEEVGKGRKVIEGAAEATELFQKHLVPATERLREMGIAIEDIDATNLREVLAYITLLNQATAKGPYFKRRPPPPPTNPPGDGDGSNDRLDAIRESLYTEEEVIRASYEKRLGIIRDELAKGRATADEAYDLRVKLAEDLETRLTDLAERNAEQRSRIRQWETGDFLNYLAASTAGAAQHYRAAFQLNKIASLGIATVRGIEAVQSAYAWGASWGGPPGGAAMAAVALAATAANIAAINQAHFGGGTTPGAAGSVPTVGGQPAPQVPAIGATESGGGRTVTITFNIQTLDKTGVEDAIHAAKQPIVDVVQEAYDARAAVGGPLR